MAQKGLTDPMTERAKAIADAETETFSELISISGLDPSGALRFTDCSGVDFGGSILRGFDFTGARLHGCEFSGAMITGARFDQAEIDRAGTALEHSPAWGGSWGNAWGDSWGKRPARDTNLRAAEDWAAYVKGWQRPKRLIGDDHLPVGAVFQDAPFGPEMVVVPPGEFLMGSPDDEPGRNVNEGPQHLVRINQVFAVGRYAVTFEEWDFAQNDRAWRIITGLEPRVAHDEGWGRGRRPVINVSCDDARAFAKWLSARTGREYRLLSEAEWEYAARAGTATPFWCGLSITTDQANYHGDYIYNWGGETEVGTFRKLTVPVDEFAPNLFGLYQVHGNVYEWVEDCWHNNYEGAPDDGSVWMESRVRSRVIRGGSWIFRPEEIRSASRFWDNPESRKHTVGFRLARTLNLYS